MLVLLLQPFFLLSFLNFESIDLSLLVEQLAEVVCFDHFNLLFESFILGLQILDLGLLNLYVQDLLLDDVL